MTSIILNKSEFDFFEGVCAKAGYPVPSFLTKTGEYLIALSDNEVEKYSEMIKDAYVFEGFDENYKLTPKGRTFEVLIDKFYSIGW